jgi:hypothetical protein
MVVAATAIVGERDHQSLGGAVIVEALREL